MEASYGRPRLLYRLEDGAEGGDEGAQWLHAANLTERAHRAGEEDQTEIVEEEIVYAVHLNRL
jgi:hypothetical protein